MIPDAHRAAGSEESRQGMPDPRRLCLLRQPHGGAAGLALAHVPPLLPPPLPPAHLYSVSPQPSLHAPKALTTRSPGQVGVVLDPYREYSERNRSRCTLPSESLCQCNARAPPSTVYVPPLLPPSPRSTSPAFLTHSTPPPPSILLPPPPSCRAQRYTHFLSASTRTDARPQARIGAHRRNMPPCLL